VGACASAGGFTPVDPQRENRAFTQLESTEKRAHPWILHE
jgi:hypothetical protein